MTTPSFETLAYDLHEGIATITLNRPEKLNAFNVQMREDLGAAFDLTDADDAVGAVIVTGAGRAFCSGSDLAGGDPAQPAGGAANPTDVPRDGAGLVTLRIFDSLKPVIAAVNGAAVGIGVTMLLPMDVRLASTEARFGLVFNRRGIVMEGASTWFLPRLVGMSNALDWVYSGRIFPAQEALDKGLVSALHAPGELIPAARALARQYIDEVAPVSVSLTRQMCWRMAGAAHPMEAHRAESRALKARRDHPDAREGIASFLEKRPAQFAHKVSADLPDIWPEWIEPEFR